MAGKRAERSKELDGQGFVPVASMGDALMLAPVVADAMSAQDLDITAAAIARTIVSSSTKRVIGLLPAGPAADPIPVADQLGSAVVVLSDLNAVVIDPEKRSVPKNGVDSSLGFVAAMRAPGVVLVAPHKVHAVGAKAEGVKELLNFVSQRKEQWRVTFVDLTGCALPGEIADVLPLCDGVIVVARARRVTERQLRQACSRVPDELLMGTALAD